jgi:hypothetical protein
MNKTLIAIDICILCLSMFSIGSALSSYQAPSWIMLGAMMNVDESVVAKEF